MGHDDPKSRLRLGLILAAVFLLLYAGYWALFRAGTRPASEAGGPAFPDKPRETATAPGASGGRSSLPEAPTAQGPVTPTELDELFNLLADADDHPVARKFAKEFVAEPALTKAYEEFRADQESSDPKISLAGFAKRIGETPEFRRLMARFGQDPGFKDAALVFLKVPKLRAVAQDQIASMKTTIAARGRRAAASGSASKIGGSRLASLPGGRRSAATTSAAQSALSGPGGGGAGGGEAIRTGGAGAATTAEADGGAGEHDVGPLGSIGGAGSGKAMNPFASLCLREDGITKAQCLAIEEHLGEYDLWEACIRANLYEKCRSLCETKPGLKCGTAPNLYEECLTADLSESTCLAKCTATPRCTPPPPPPPPPPPATAGPGGAPGGTTSTPGGGPTCTPRTYEKIGGYCTGDRWLMTKAYCTCTCPGGRESCGCGTPRVFSCFPAGTRIETPDGPKAIETLRPGDRAFAVDPASGELIVTRVAANSRASGKKLLSAVLADGREVRATEEHPFWDPDAGEYRPLGKWRPGQRMLARSAPGAPFAPVALVRLEEAPGEHEVFNLTIEHANHNYVAEGFVVHNKFICD